MSRQAISVTYCNWKIKTTSKSELKADLKNKPLTNEEESFLVHIIEGASYKELAEIYGISISAAAKRKRKLFDRLYQYDHSH